MATRRDVTPAVSLVMPCYNEEACLRRTATDLVEAFAAKSIPLQLVLVDNGSRDRTGGIIDELIAQGLPVSRVTVPVNLGYGHGVLQGLSRCTAPMVGYLCADGQVAAAEAVRTYEEARDAGVPALAKVRRRFRKDSWRRRLVSILYNLGMPVLFGWLNSIDLNASPKILPRESMLLMELQSKDWFLDPELMIKAKRMGLRVLERDVEGLPRAGGKSSVRYSTCLQFIRNILRYRFEGALPEWERSVQLHRRASAEASPAGVPAPGQSSLR